MFSKLKSLISLAYRGDKRMLSSFTKFSEQKIHLPDAELDVNYVRSGDGAKAVLLMPGACGSAWTDFRPQIEKLPESLPNHSIIAWDPPGYGRSIPPKRQFSADFFRKDADFASSLMRALSFDKYSVLGWSDGGITAMILAAKNSQCVDRLVIWGCNAYILPEELNIVESMFHCFFGLSQMANYTYALSLSPQIFGMCPSGHRKCERRWSNYMVQRISPSCGRIGWALMAMCTKPMMEIFARQI